MLNQWPVMQNLVQCWMADQVRLSSSVNVPAVTVPIESGRVLRIQSAIQAPMTLFPVPCPEVAVMRIGITGSMPLKARAATSLPRSNRNCF